MQKVRVREGLKDIYFIDKERKERERERCDSERDQKFKRRAYTHRKKIKNKWEIMRVNKEKLAQTLVCLRWISIYCNNDNIIKTRICLFMINYYLLCGK